MSDRPTYDVKTDFYIILIVPITFNIINLFGSTYIFYRTYLRWKFDYRKISLSFRFPFYISITDFLVSSLGLINFLYSAVKGPTAMLNGGVITWPSPFCQVLAFSSTVSILANILLVGAISITTWIRVVRECYIKFGKYDYKILLPVIFLSLLIPLITVHSFGPQKYWCGGDGNKLLTALMTSAIMITLLVIVVCYVHVLKAIHNVKDELSDSHSNSVHRTDIERKCLRKVLTYIFVFILQYIPIVIFEVCRYMKVRHIIMFALAPSAISIGGIGNIIQYLRNEGFSAPSTSNASSSNSRLQGSGQQSGTTDSVNISVTENME